MDYRRQRHLHRMASVLVSVSVAVPAAPAAPAAPVAVAAPAPLPGLCHALVRFLVLSFSRVVNKLQWRFLQMLHIDSNVV